MSEPFSIQSSFTVNGPSPWGPVMSMPRIAPACSRASSSFWAILMPPALPRPPIFTCALMAQGKPTSLAAETASSTVLAGRPSGTGIPCRAKSCLPWYSSRSIGGSDAIEGSRRCFLPERPEGLGGARNGTMPSRMALPKNIQWITFGVYGTLIDWESGVADAFEREAKKDGFTIDRTQVVDLFLDATKEIQSGSYELYAEVLRQAAVKIAKEIGWPLEPSRSGF